MNIRKTWNINNEILGKNKQNPDKLIVKAMKTKVPNISNLFPKSFKDSVNSINHNCNTQTFHSSAITYYNSMYMEPTTQCEVLRILSTLNSNKGPGIDEIRPKDLKNNAEVLSKPIEKLINMSLSQGKIPSTEPNQE